MRKLNILRLRRRRRKRERDSADGWTETEIPQAEGPFSDESRDGIEAEIGDAAFLGFLDALAASMTKWVLQDESLTIFVGRIYHGMEVRIDSDEPIRYRTPGRGGVEIEFRDGHRIGISRPSSPGP